jgi:hypothetical protein
VLHSPVLTRPRAYQSYGVQVSYLPIHEIIALSCETETSGLDWYIPRYCTNPVGPPLKRRASTPNEGVRSAPYLVVTPTCPTLVTTRLQVQVRSTEYLSLKHLGRQYVHVPLRSMPTFTCQVKQAMQSLLAQPPTQMVLHGQWDAGKGEGKYRHKVAKHS